MISSHSSISNRFHFCIYNIIFLRYDTCIYFKRRTTIQIPRTHETYWYNLARSTIFFFIGKVFANLQATQQETSKVRQQSKNKMYNYNQTGLLKQTSDQSTTCNLPPTCTCFDIADYFNTLKQKYTVVSVFRSYLFKDTVIFIKSTLYFSPLLSESTRRCKTQEKKQYSPYVTALFVVFV